MKAVLLPVRSPLAGHMITLSLKKPKPNSINAPAARQIRIWAIDSRKSRTVWPRTWRVRSTAATWRRGSRTEGRRTGYSRPRMVTVRRLGAGRLRTPDAMVRQRTSNCSRYSVVRRFAAFLAGVFVLGIGPACNPFGLPAPHALEDGAAAVLTSATSYEIAGRYTAGASVWNI